jgi:hypothetical protein
MQFWNTFAFYNDLGYIVLTLVEGVPHSSFRRAFFGAKPNN